MLERISYRKARKLCKKGEIGRVLYVYSDGTEAYADKADSCMNLKLHFERGGKFAVET